MTVVNIANEVVAHVKNRQHNEASKKISHLINSNAALGRNWGGIARLSITIGEYKYAAVALKHYLADANEDTGRIIQVAGLYAEIGNLNEAIALVTPIIGNGVDAQVFHLLGTVHSQLGNHDIAKDYLERALKLVPDSGITLLTLASLTRQDSSSALFKHIKSLETLKSNANHPIDAPYWFSYGKSLLDNGKKQKAFDKIAIGNSILGQQSNYNSDMDRKFVDYIVNLQNAKFLEAMPHNNSQDNQVPIFIVGLPRSGTTLLLQFLSGHSSIHGGGEFPGISLAMLNHANTLLQGQRSTQQYLSSINTIYQKYIDVAQQKWNVANGSIIVDKTLNINRYLGLISKVFPQSPIIRIKRNPLDNAWSCYRNMFNQGLEWSYDLKNIAQFFNCENELANHWDSMLGDRILTIRYEDLVTNPVDTIKKCLTHCHLPYEENTLNFQQSSNPVFTASVGQVRQPLTTRSIDCSQDIAPLMKEFSQYYKQ